MGVLASMLEFVVILGTHQTGLPDESVKSIRLHLMSDWDGTRGNNRLAAQPLGHPAFPFIADCRDGAAAELFPALLSTGMLGTEQCIEKSWVLRRSAPLRPISLPQD